MLAMKAWLLIFASAAAGHFGALGATAPTSKRLGTLSKAVCDVAPIDTMQRQVQGAWGIIKVDDYDLTTVSGHVIQFRSTMPGSDATGSAIQGWNWPLGAIVDEAQDSVEQGAYPNIVARLRSGGEEVAPIFASATAKASSTFRNWRDGLSDSWEIHRLSYLDTPFVHYSYWLAFKEECTVREWRRRGLALDVGPERATYPEFERDLTIVPIPHNAEDVTEEILSRWGNHLKVLAGFDPGKLCDVTLLFKAYRIPGVRRHVWYCVDEITTYSTTTAGHVRTLLARLRDKWNCNVLDRTGQPSEFGPKVFVRADPYSDSGRDEGNPDKSVYTTFRNAGITILPAATKATTSKVTIAQVPKEAGIEMVCTMLCNTGDQRRLRIAIGEDRQPVAPNLAKALEFSSRDGDGKAEAQKKNKDDLSHWGAATRYAFWMLEKPRYQELMAV